MYRPCIVAVLLSLCGCASLGPQQTEQREQVRDSSERTEREATTVRKPTAQWTDGNLSARFERNEVCSPMLDQSVEVTTYAVRPAQNLGLATVVSGLALAGGIAAAIVWVPMSQKPEYANSAEGEVTAADWVGAAALFGVLGGGWGLYRALNVYGASRPRATGEVQKLSRTIPNGEPRTCGPKLEPVTVKIQLGRETITRGFHDGIVDLGFAREPSLCPTSAIGEGVAILWEAGSDSGELWSGSLDDCARIHAARQLLSGVRAQLVDAPTPQTIASGSDAYQQAKTFLAATDRAYPGRGELLADAAKVERLLKDGAVDALEAARNRLQSLDEGDFEELYSPGRETIATSRLVEGAFAETWLLVNTLYGRSIRSSHEARVVIEGDRHVRQCVVEGICEDGLAPDTARAAFAPVVSKAKRDIARSTKAVRDSARKLSSNAAEQQMELERGTVDWCEVVTWTDELAAPCAALVKARESAWVQISKNEQKEVRDAVARTERSWRGKFGTCRKLTAGIQAMREIPRGECGRDCRKVFQRMEADFEALKQFSVAEPRWTGDSLRSVQEDCRKAGCPKCPQGE